MTNICQVGGRHQITEPRNPENPNKEKIRRKQWHACTYFQATENQRQKPFKADSKKGLAIYTETKARLCRFPITNCATKYKKEAILPQQKLGDPLEEKRFCTPDREDAEWKH